MDDGGFQRRETAGDQVEPVFRISYDGGGWFRVKAYRSVSSVRPYYKSEQLTHADAKKKARALANGAAK